MNKTPLNVAIIGMGSMGKKHYQVLKQIEDLNVCTVDPKVEESDYKSVESLLSNNRLDIAVIATPTTMHHELALQLINSGVSVLIEKPVFKEYPGHLQLEEIQHSLEKNNCKLAVGHIERFNPAITALMHDIEGKYILNCSFTRMSPYPSRIIDVGVKMDLAVHDVDLVRYITGKEILNCSSISSCNRGKNEDLASFFISTEGGCSSTILTSWLSPYRKRTIEIMADSANYKVDLINQTVTKYTENNNNSFLVTNLFINKENSLKKQLTQFIEYATIGTCGPLAILDDGLQAIKHCL